MSKIEQEKNEKDSLMNLLSELEAINTEELIRSEELGKQLSFESGQPYFKRTLKLFHDLYEANLDNVPITMLQKLKTHATEVISHINLIREFSPTDSNPISTRDSLVNNFINSYTKYFQDISPIISYSIRKGTDFEVLENQAKETLTQLKAISKETEKKSSQAIAEAEATLNKMRQAAAEVGVAQHATHFQEEAKYYASSSIKWLITTCVMGFFTIVWAIFSFKFHLFSITGDLTTVEIIESVASKLVVLSVLYYILVFSAKNYSTQRHNYVVNKHRQNALSTFETFIKAAGDDIDTKNAVLLQTTHSIFGLQSSGYVQNDIDQESPSKIIEILRSAGTVNKG